VSIRSMAAEAGFSHTTIRRMWAAFGLQPHLLDGDVIGRNVDEVGAIAREKSANDSVVAP
jgi:hypothetical protein